LHKRRTTLPPALATEADQGRVKVRLALGTFDPALEPLLDKCDTASTGILHRKDVAEILTAMDAGKAPAEETISWVQDLADCRAECIPRKDIKSALSLFLALRDTGAAGVIRATFQRQFGEETILAARTVSDGEIEAVLTSLNGNRPPSMQEFAWVRSMAEEDQPSQNHPKAKHKHDLHRAVAFWYPHVHARTPISREVSPAGSGKAASNAGVRRRALAVQLPVHKAWVEAAFRQQLDNGANHDGSVEIAILEQLMETLSGEAVDPSELQFVTLLSDQDMDGKCARADLEVAVAMWKGLRSEMGRIESSLERHGQLVSAGGSNGKFSRQQVAAMLTEINEGHPPTKCELNWVLRTGKQQHLLPIDAPVTPAALNLTSRLQGGGKKPAQSLEIPPAPTSFSTTAMRRGGGSAGSTSAGPRPRGRAYGGHQEIVSPATMAAIEAVSSESEAEDEATPLFSPSKSALAGPASAGGGRSGSQRGLFSLLSSSRQKKSLSDLYLSSETVDSQPEHKQASATALAPIASRSAGGGGRDLKSDVSTGGLNLMELRVAICLWYYHCATIPLRPHVGCKMLVPFLYTLSVSAGAAYIVAATTLLFSEQKTIEWIGAVAMSLLWRNFVIDPLKAVAFGRSFELAFGLLLSGSCSFEQATLGVLQDEMEGQGEALGEMAGDGAARAFGDVNMDVAVVATDAATPRRTKSQEEEQEEDEENAVSQAERPPSPLWATRNDASHRASGVARDRGLLGP